MMFCQAAVSVVDPSQIGEARRETNRIARLADLDESRCGDASIVATELATNLHRYATKGELLIRNYEIAATSGIELIAIDRGPGMSNVAICMEDGYSSGGSMGQGLGAVKRLATHFDIFSDQPGGTVVFARIEKKGPVPAHAFEWGVINRPAPHETLCGDTWRISGDAGEVSLMIADGLGHGPLAAVAADSAGSAFESEAGASAAEYLAIADRRLRGTRGAAVAVAYLDTKGEVLRFSGVGNIAGSIRDQGSLTGKGLVSHNGTVGVVMRKVQQFDYACKLGSLLTMHSDGLKTRWSFEPYPGLMMRHPAIIAGILYRDFRRDHDDVTVCVIRNSRIAA